MQRLFNKSHISLFSIADVFLRFNFCIILLKYIKLFERSKIPKLLKLDFFLAKASNVFIWKFIFVGLFFTPCLVFSQTFSGRGGALQDFDQEIHPDTFTIFVNSPNRLDGKQEGLRKVCMDVSHARSSDLKISLINPNGNTIWLTNRNGAESGRDYTQTCFSQNGFFGYIHQNENPFNGEFIPDGRFENLNETNSSLNGRWLLIIEDLRPGVKGFLGAWDLQFGKLDKVNTKKRCSLENPKYCRCEDGKKNGDMLPDLVLLPSFTKNQMDEYGPDHPQYPSQIRFAASIANIGYGPMEIRGDHEWFCNDSNQPVDSVSICKDGTYARQNILQRIYYKERNEIKYKEVKTGTNYYDSKPGHNHYHVDDWVEYRLKQELGNGLEKTICTGVKVSYCLFDSGICNDQDDICNINNKRYGIKSLKNYSLGKYTSCHAGVQGISVGGYDTYGSMYEGQFLELPAGTKNGSYILEIEVDPKSIYIESNKENNILRIPINLTRQENL